MTSASVSSSARHHTQRPDRPAVSISMRGDTVVASVDGTLDIDATRALVGAVEGAVRSGLTVAVDLVGESPLPPASEIVTAVEPTGADGHVTVGAAGFVQLAVGDNSWVVDLVDGRLCRGTGTIDPATVADDEWVGMRAIWLTRSSVHALTADGGYLSRSADWTFDR